MAPSRLIWTLVCLLALGGSTNGQHSAEEALIDFASYVDSLDAMPLGLRVNGFRSDSQGPFREVILSGMMIREPDIGMVYMNWGNQYLEPPAFGASTDPSLTELRRIRKASGDFSYAVRRSGNWEGNAFDTKRLANPEEIASILSLLPGENLALLELIAMRQLVGRDVTSRSHSESLMNRVFLNERSDGNVIVAQWKNEKGVTRYTYEFAKAIAWRPQKIASVFIDKEGNVKGKSWECELEWKLHEGIFRQHKSKSLTYFPSGLVQEMQLKFQWASSKVLSRRINDFKKYGYDPTNDKFDKSTNWLQEAELFFQDPKNGPLD